MASGWPADGGAGRHGGQAAIVVVPISGGGPRLVHAVDHDGNPRDESGPQVDGADAEARRQRRGRSAWPAARRRGGK